MWPPVKDRLAAVAGRSNPAIFAARAAVDTARWNPYSQFHMRRIGASSGGSPQNIFPSTRLIHGAFLALITCLALRASGIANTPCPGSGTLDQLIALNGNATPGCTIDGLNYSGFAWNETGGNTTVAANQVSFTTSTSPGGLGVLDLSSSSQFSVSGSGANDALNYTLTYEIDPPPIIIRMFDQDLFDPVVSPGIADVATTICLGAAWAGGVCPTSTVSVDTFDHGGGVNQLTDSVTFAPQSTVGISTAINLEANGASASITGFGDTTQALPEPSTYLLVALGLAALLWLRSKRARLLSISVRRSD
jgi:hypothetical protein